LDGVLRSHLQAVTEAFSSKDWEQHYNGTKNKHPNPDLRRSQLNLQAKKFRQQGNARIKYQDFAEAQLLYTQSIAAAIEGPLCSLAYYDRFVIFRAWELCANFIIRF
jgi:hypothetical protein